MSKREYCHTISQQYNCPRCLLIDLEKASNKIKEPEAKLEIAVSALKCNETFHRLGGIDDCEPCQALEKLRGESV